jgi:hypothetical protein
MRIHLLKVVFLLFLFSAGFTGFAAEIEYKKMDNLNFIIDFEFKEFSKKPCKCRGEILLPMREFFETIGATVEWNDERKRSKCFFSKIIKFS